MNKMLINSMNDLYNTSNNSKFQIKNTIQKEDFDKNCFDCGKMNPELISINNGIYICQKCGMDHMLLPGGTSILIKNDIKSLSEKEKLFLEYGGNIKLYEFVLNNCPSLIKLPRKFLYTSSILYHYQKQLQQLVYENTNPIKTKREIFQNKLSRLQINPNYSLKEINNSLATMINSNASSSLKRFNTTTNLNTNDYMYKENSIKINTLSNKIKKNNDNNCKLDESIQNYLFTQKTNNTHANTISSNNVTYTETSNENNNMNKNEYFNKCYENIKQIPKNKNFLIKSRIVYNKPRLSKHKTNTLKIENNYKYNNSTNYFDNIYNTINNCNNNNFKNNFIENTDVIDNIFIEQIKKPLKKINKTYFFKEKINQNIEDNYIHTDTDKEKSKEIISPNFKSNIFKINYIDNNINLTNRYSARVSKRKKTFSNYIDNILPNQKKIKSERKIKEIIINKKMNKSNDDFDNLDNNLNRTHIKSKTFLENRKPIQVNLNVQSAFHKYQNDNYKLNNYLKDYNLHEIIINNDYSNDSINDKTETKSTEVKNDNKLGINYIKSQTVKTSNKKIKKYNTNTVHLNINKNLKKEYKNINNSFQEKKKKKIIGDNINKENIYINNTFNKIINYNNYDKNTYDSKKGKKIIYFKNKINNNNFNIKNIKVKQQQNRNISVETTNKKEKEKEISTEKIDIFKKEYVEQFQILPVTTQKENTSKKIKNNNQKGNKNIKEVNPLIKSQDFAEKHINENNLIRNTVNENESKNIRYYLYNSTNKLINGETFKNSIRNRYKRERSNKKE